MNYQEFDDASYTSLRKSLLRLKGSEKQQEFLRVLRSNENFSEWIRDEVEIAYGTELPILDEAMSESEYKDPPKSTERQIFQHWNWLPPAIACRVTLWGFISLRHIEERRIQPSFLAANGGNLTGGLQRIDYSIKNGDAREIDRVVRTALRRLSGLPEARGNRSVYVNCPFARAWWRRYLANEVMNTTSAKLNDVIKVLGYSQQYWEELISIVVSKNSILGDTKIRTALVWALSDLVNKEEHRYLFQGNSVQKIRRHIGIRSAWQELGVFDVTELKEYLETDVIPSI